MTVKFREWECNVNKVHYQQGNICLQLTDVKDGDGVATATTNIPEIQVFLGKNDVIIKDYSENSGMLACLVEAGVISGVKKQFPLNQFGTQAYVCECLI